VSARQLAREGAERLRSVSGDDAAFEAEVLVRHASGLERAEYFSGAGANPAQAHAAIERRLMGEPLAYITGSREFYAITFGVSPAVLIPRPETELLVDLALEELDRKPEAIVVDVGSGSGCVGIAIAANRREAGRTLMVDVSAQALAVARRNAETAGVECGLVQSSLAAALEQVDIVVANLPYIPTDAISSLQPEVRDWEPRLALDGGPDGLRLIAALVQDCGERLRPGLLLLEVGDGQADAVQTMLHRYGASSVAAHRDLAGIERVVAARWPQR
jgi:release factor glutamine methyltransferase